MAPVKGSDSRASAARSVEALQPRKSSEHEMASAKRLQASLKYREALKIQTQKSKMKKSKDVCHPTAQNEQTYLKTGDRRIGLKQVLLNTCSLDHKDWNSSESEKKVDEIIRQMELERQASERAFLERFYEDCKRVRINPVLYPAPSPQSQSRSADKERRITNLCRHSDKPYLKTGDRRIGLKQVLLNTRSLDHKDWNSSESEKKVDGTIQQMELERQASESAFLQRFYEDCKRVRVNPVLYPAPSPQSQSRNADKERRIANLCRHFDNAVIE